MIYKPLVMSNEEYHSKTKYESSSTVRKVLTSPKKYLYDKTAESVPTKAMEEGTAVHTYFLEINYLRIDIALNQKHLMVGLRKVNNGWKSMVI